MSMGTTTPVDRPAQFLARFGPLGARIGGRLKPDLVTRSLRYGLRRDLSQPIVHVEAKIPVSVRPLVERDLDVLLPADPWNWAPEDRLEVKWRRDFVDKVGIAGCHVAVDDRDGTPCYMQWLFDPSRNGVIASLGGFPKLQPGEALLENAWTPPIHRGLGIMSAAMARIAERAEDVDARYVLTFVGSDNIASLKGCRRAGFDPHLTHERSYLVYGLVKTDRFAVLPEGDPRRHWQMPG